MCFIRCVVLIVSLALLPACTFVGVDGVAYSVEPVEDFGAEGDADSFYAGAMFGCVDSARLGYVRAHGQQPNVEAAAMMVAYCGGAAKRYREMQMMEFWNGFMESLSTPKPKGSSL